MNSLLSSWKDLFCRKPIRLFLDDRNGLMNIALIQFYIYVASVKHISPKNQLSKVKNSNLKASYCINIFILNAFI